MSEAPGKKKKKTDKQENTSGLSELSRLNSGILWPELEVKKEEKCGEQRTLTSGDRSVEFPFAVEG